MPDVGKWDRARGVRYVAAEDSHVAGVGVAHLRDCVSALVEAGAKAGGAGGEAEGDAGGVHVERCGTGKREEEREAKEREMHILLGKFDVLEI